MSSRLMRVSSLPVGSEKNECFLEEFYQRKEKLNLTGILRSFQNLLAIHSNASLSSGSLNETAKKHILYPFLGAFSYLFQKTSIFHNRQQRIAYKMTYYFDHAYIFQASLIARIAISAAAARLRFGALFSAEIAAMLFVGCIRQCVVMRVYFWHFWQESKMTLAFCVC